MRGRGREGGREMESEWEREGEGGRDLVCCVCCLSSRPSILCVNIIYVLYMCVQDLRLTKCLCTPNSHMHGIPFYTLVNVEGLELRLLCMCHVVSE